MQIISGLHKGKKLFCPQLETLRPTSSKLRGAIFNICQLSIENACFLDLCAGMGAIGLEALSRGAKKVIFVEHDKKASLFIKKNIAKLKEEERTHILQMDMEEALLWLNKKGYRFDIIFVDPPYGTDQFLSNRALELIDSLELLNEGGELFLEDDAKAEKEICALKQLHLNSRRSLGRTLLRHYRHL